MIRLSVSDRFGALPTPVRSSGHVGDAAPGSPSRGGRLATTSPPIADHAAAAAETGDRPRPARSGRCRRPPRSRRSRPPGPSSDTPRRAGSRGRCSASTSLDREDHGARLANGVCLDEPRGRSGRPSAGPGRAFVAPAAGRPAAVTRPRRMTVIRSAIARTSSELVADEDDAPAARRSSTAASGTARRPPAARAPRSARPGSGSGRRGRAASGSRPAAARRRDSCQTCARGSTRSRTRRPRRPTSVVERASVEAEARAGRGRGGRSRSTVCDGTSVKCWWTIPRPAAIASRGERNATGRPSTRISPSSGR